MYRNIPAVASANTKTTINGYTRIVQQFIDEGFEPYLMSFMFNPKRVGSRDQHLQVIDDVTRVYCRFITEVIRNPRKRGQTESRPILIGTPDYPVFKWSKPSGREIQDRNDGVHFHGMLLIPPFNRLKVGVKDHFTTKRKAYIGPDFPLSRIHVKHIESDIPFTVDYVMKALKHGWCSNDDILLLPKSRGE